MTLQRQPLFLFVSFAWMNEYKQGVGSCECDGFQIVPMHMTAFPCFFGAQDAVHDGAFDKYDRYIVQQPVGEYFNRRIAQKRHLRNHQPVVLTILAAFSLSLVQNIPQTWHRVTARYRLYFNIFEWYSLIVLKRYNVAMVNLNLLIVVEGLCGIHEALEVFMRVLGTINGGWFGCVSVDKIHDLKRVITMRMCQTHGIDMFFGWQTGVKAQAEVW